MREKKDMRDKNVCTKKKEKLKKKKEKKKEKKERKKMYLRKGRKHSTCFGCGSHVYWFTE